jgi:hypothetical protein
MLSHACREGPPLLSLNFKPQGDLYVPHFADGGGYSTQFILLGTPGQSSMGVLQFFLQSGQSLPMLLYPP